MGSVQAGFGADCRRLAVESAIDIVDNFNMANKIMADKYDKYSEFEIARAEWILQNHSLAMKVLKENWCLCTPSHCYIITLSLYHIITSFLFLEILF